MTTFASMTCALKCSKCRNSAAFTVDFVDDLGSDFEDAASSSEKIRSEGKEDPRNELTTLVVALWLASYLAHFARLSS